MKKFVDFLQFNFLPKSPDVALLVLRLWFGLSLLLLHGMKKLSEFGNLSAKFPDPLGVGHQTSLILALFGEVVCAVLLVLGLFTRFAALSCAITMCVAFFLVHKMALSGEHSGEMAFMYLAGYVALLIAGGGRYSLDAKLNSPLPKP